MRVAREGGVDDIRVLSGWEWTNAVANGHVRSGPALGAKLVEGAAEEASPASPFPRNSGNTDVASRVTRLPVSAHTSPATVRSSSMEFIDRCALVVRDVRDFGERVGGPGRVQFSEHLIGTSQRDHAVLAAVHVCPVSGAIVRGSLRSAVAISARALGSARQHPIRAFRVTCVAVGVCNR